MTISDLIKRLQSHLTGESYFSKVSPGAQVKLGRELDNKDSVFEYFEVVRDGNDIVLVPTGIWDRHKKN